MVQIFIHCHQYFSLRFRHPIEYFLLFTLSAQIIFSRLNVSVKPTINHLDIAHIWCIKLSKLNLFHHHHHHHHVVPPARISLTLSRHFSLSFIASGRSSGLHPVSSQSCCMYVQAGRPAFARPYVGVHRSTSLMSSSLLLQQCPACLIRLTWIVFVMGGRWPYSWCFVGVLPPELVQYCSQHSCVIAV